MAKRLFVGSLPWATTSERLKEMFSKAGNVVSATVIADKFSGRSKGYGFVEMETDDEADKAVKELNGLEEEGRKIVVAEARPREERGGEGGGRGGRGGWHDKGAPAAEAPAESTEEAA